MWYLFVNLGTDMVSPATHVAHFIKSPVAIHVYMALYSLLEPEVLWHIIGLISTIFYQILLNCLSILYSRVCGLVLYVH